MDGSDLKLLLGQKKGKILHLGCGRVKIPGTIGIDVRHFFEVDIIADLNKKLPFDSGSVDTIISNHSLEHLNYKKIMNEMLRVLKVGGKNIIIVPHYSNHRAYMGEHITSGFSWIAFEHFRSNQHPFYNFEVVENKILFGKTLSFITKIVNCNNRLKYVYERFFCGIFPAVELLVILEKKPIHNKKVERY